MKIGFSTYISKLSLNKKKIATVFLTIAFLVLVAISLLPVQYSLTIEFVKPSRTDDASLSNNVCEVFYNVENKSSARSAYIPREGVNSQDMDVSAVTIPLPSRKVTAIRIDPGTMPKVWNIKSIALRCKMAGRSIYSHVWLPDDIVKDFQPVHSIDTFSVRDGLLYLNASGVDPYFGYKGDFGKVYNIPLKRVLYFKLIFYAVIIAVLLILFILKRKAVFAVLVNTFSLITRPLAPFPKPQFVSPLWFWVILFVLAAIKIWLVSSHMFPAINSPHDDELFLRLGRNIAAGKWLGNYNNVTLLKRPFYPFWIACMFWLGIPLSLSQHLLYICSCLLFVVAIRPLLRNNPLLLLIIYATLTFHPISYAGNQMARVLRAGIYISLPLLVLSFATGLLLRKDASMKTLKRWNIGLGLSFAAFWLTREEGVLLLPSLFIILCAFVVSILLFSQDKLKRIMLCRISVGLSIVIIMATAGVNKIYYGVFTTGEQRQRDFVNAYSSLVRVKSKPFQRYLPVPREKRERIYAISPAFAELSPFLEGDIGKGWSQWGPYAGKDISTHFMFALRDAVARAGYCSSGGAAAKYYQRLALEVNNACDKGLIECHPRGSPFLPKSAYKIPWRREYLKPLLITYKSLIFSVARLERISILPRLENSGPDAVLCLFRDITRSRVSVKQNDPMVLPCQQRLDSFKISILNYFLSFYRLYMSILVVLGVISYGWHIVSIALKRGIDFPFIIMTALLLAVLLRLYLLSLVEVTLAPSWRHCIMYQSPLFPLLTAFSIMSILMLFLKCDKKYVFPFASFKLKK